MTCGLSSAPPLLRRTVLLTQAAWGHPDSDTTSGLVGYLGDEPPRAPTAGRERRGR